MQGEYMQKVSESYGNEDEQKKYTYNGKEYNAIPKIVLGKLAARTLDYVKKYNAVLEKVNESRAEGEKLPLLDANKCMDDLLARAKNPEYVALYNISYEITNREEKQNTIMDNLKKLYPQYSELSSRNYLARSLKFLFRTDGTDEDFEYNKKLFESYIKNPEGFTYARYKKMLDLDPKEIIACGDDKVKNLEYYRDHTAFLYECNEFNDPIRVGEYKYFGANNDFINNVESFKGMYQKMNYPSGKVNTRYGNYSCFMGIPNLTQEQAKAIQKNYGKVHFEVVKDENGIERNKPINMPVNEQAHIRDMAGDPDPRVIPQAYFKSLEDKGLKVDKDIFLKYKPIYTNPNTGKQEVVSLQRYLNGENNITLHERTKDEIDRIKNMTKAYDLKCNFEFQKRMGEALETDYNIFKIINENKGGFMENLFNKTSKEYNEFIKALADYTNPDKSGNGYLDKDSLGNKALKYLQHTQDVKPEKNETNATRASRIRLANAVIDTLSGLNTDKKKLDAEFYNQIVGDANQYANDVKKEIIDEDSIYEENNELLNESNEALNKTINEKDNDLSVDDDSMSV